MLTLSVPLPLDAQEELEQLGPAQTRKHTQLAGIPETPLTSPLYLYSLTVPEWRIRFVQNEKSLMTRLPWHSKSAADTYPREIPILRIFLSIAPLFSANLRS
jgi:hypothetical protein